MELTEKKILILLPDGVGLRNFAYSKFYEIGKSQGFKIVYWNKTVFSLSDFGYDEIKINHSKTHPLTEIYKNARKHIEFNLSIRKSGNNIYNHYRFKPKYNGLKSTVKNVMTGVLIATHNSEKGLGKIRAKINKYERRTDYYQQCLHTLRDEKPSMVLCTNQRHITAVAPILAASDLQIPTATFVFSWDNLPKATMVLEPDYYFVWSELMKEQLLYYYPYVNAKQILITGTPQFEPHFDELILFDRETFFKLHGMDLQKKYICFSGDDVTTSPDDPQYLEDTAQAIHKLNEQGHNLGIIFRRCPVDFSGRYNAVVSKHRDIIVEILPRWKSLHESWDTIFPEAEDQAVLANTIFHSEMVINLGSSMVFDYAAFGKPCGFLNYNQAQQTDPNWDIHTIYKFIHFLSMPNKNVVFWLDSQNGIADQIDKMLKNPTDTVNAAKAWFKIINSQPPQLASKRLWESISAIQNRNV